MPGVRLRLWLVTWVVWLTVYTAQSQKCYPQIPLGLSFTSKLSAGGFVYLESPPASVLNSTLILPLSGTTAGFALRGAQAFDATSLRQTWSVAWLVDSTGAGTGTKFTQAGGILYVADTLSQAILPGSDAQLTGLYLFALNVTDTNNITTLWATPFPGGAAVLIPPVLTTDGGVFVGVQTRGGDQVVVGADGRTGALMKGAVRLSTLDPPAMFSTGGGAALQPLALGVVAVFPIQPQGTSSPAPVGLLGVYRISTVNSTAFNTILQAWAVGRPNKPILSLAAVGPPSGNRDGFNSTLVPTAVAVAPDEVWSVDWTGQVTTSPSLSFSAVSALPPAVSLTVPNRLYILTQPSQGSYMVVQLAVSNDTGVITSSGPSATLPPSAAFAFGLAVNSNPDGLAGGQGCAVVVVTARSSSGAATVYALDMTSGAMLWQTPVSGSAPENVPALSQPLFVGSLLLFSGTDGKTSTLALSQLRFGAASPPPPPNPPLPPSPPFYPPPPFNAASQQRVSIWHLALVLAAAAWQAGFLGQQQQ